MHIFSGKIVTGTLQTRLNNNYSRFLNNVSTFINNNYKTFLNNYSIFINNFNLFKTEQQLLNITKLLNTYQHVQLTLSQHSTIITKRFTRISKPNNISTILSNNTEQFLHCFFCWPKMRNKQNSPSE